EAERFQFIELETFLKRVASFRCLVFTLLAHSMPWLRAALEGAERLAINSGVLDSVSGDIPELANRLRSWLGAGNRAAIPSEQPDRVQKYIGSDEAAPTLHRLGGGEWFRTKNRVKARIREMAKELLALYAARQALPGHAFGQDTVWQADMEAAFPYEETQD